MSQEHWMVARDSPSDEFAQALFLRVGINRSTGYVNEIAHQRYREALGALTLNELLLLLRVCGEKLFTKEHLNA